MHATWSAIAYRFTDQIADFILLLVLTIPVAVTMVGMSPPPARACLPWLLASIVMHIGYTLALVRANQIAHFSQLHPQSRGLAPVLVTLAVVVLPINALGSLTLSQLAGLAVGSPPRRSGHSRGAVLATVAGASHGTAR